MARSLLDIVLGVLAPPQCAACDERLPSDTVFCAACAATVVPPEETPPGAHAAAAYGGAVATAIARLKYANRTDLARPLAHLLMAHLANVVATGPIEVVVPVPLHPTRLRERGYNQAALLARPVARRLGCPFVPRALERARATKTQASLPAADRLENVAGAFRVAPDGARAVRGRRVLLVDDVRTTGATSAGCTLALRLAGAATVRVLTVAQT